MFFLLQLHNQTSILAVITHVAKLRPAASVGAGRCKGGVQAYLTTQSPDHIPAGNLMVAALVTASRLPFTNSVMV